MLGEILGELLYSKSFKLGEEVVNVSGNKPLKALDIFSSECLVSNSVKSDKRIVLYTCSCESDIYIKSLNNRDKTVRNNYLNKGYYVCDHFGKPINIMVENGVVVVLGENFSRFFWSYLIKYLMQIWALENESIFVKCAAFSINENGTILIGYGGSGKTMVNTHVCANGARFITNSNAYIKDGKIMGIASKMRIRRNEYYEKLFNLNNAMVGLSNSDLLIDPLLKFSSITNEWINIKNIVIVNYSSGIKGFISIDKETAFVYAQQFLLGINVYRLEEDILNYYGNNVIMFSEKYNKMINSLKKLIDQCNCYLADINIGNIEKCNEFMEEL